MVWLEPSLYLAINQLFIDVCRRLNGWGGNVKMDANMHGGRILDYILQTGKSREEIVDFSANINPLGPPQSVISAIQAAIMDIRDYPDATHRDVKQVIVQRENSCLFEHIPLSERLSAAQVFCGNGASEVIDLLFSRLKPQRTFLFEPAFSEYEMAARRCASNILHIPLHFEWGSFAASQDALMQIDEKVRAGDVVVVNHPHNPSGMLWDISLLRAFIIKWDSLGVEIICDESFIDFIDNPSAYSLLSLTHCCSHVWIVRSATKIFSIPGLRFGFGIGAAERVQAIEHHRDGWSVNTLAQVAARTAYQDFNFIQQTHSWLQRERQYIQDTWGSDPRIRIFASQVNFFLVQFPPGVTQVLLRTLEEMGMFVRSCANFHGLSERDIRVAIRQRADNERLWLILTHTLNRLL